MKAKPKPAINPLQIPTIPPKTFNQLVETFARSGAAKRGHENRKKK